MRIGVVYYSSELPVWICKIESMLELQFPDSKVEYVLVPQSPRWVIPGYSLYHYLDRKYLAPPNSPFDFSKSVTNTSEKDFDLLLNLSFVELPEYLSSKRIISLQFGSNFNSPSKENLIEAFLAGEEVIECFIQDSNFKNTSFIEGVNSLSWSRTVHGLFHRLHYDLNLHFSDIQCFYHEVTLKPQPRLTQIKLLKQMAIGFLKRKFGSSSWEVVLSKPEEGQSRIFSSTKDYFYADPFVLEDQGKAYLFLEKYDFKKNRAHLVVKSSEDNFELDETILETEYHLSYPQVFKENGEWFMIPETNEANSLDLYKSSSFPKKWHKIRTLIDNEQIVDATFLVFGQHNYLFLNTKIDEDYQVFNELKIYFSDNLDSSQWNQVEMPPFIDPRYARQAGSFFQKEGKLYRVSQDNSKFYGRKINVFEVLELSKTSYREALSYQIQPGEISDRYTGVHTYNESQNYKAIDALLL